MSNEIINEKLEALKEQYGELLEIGNQDKVGYFRKPYITEFFGFLDKLKKGKSEMVETMMKTLFLIGDPEILENDEYFIPIAEQLEKEVFQVGSASILKNDDGTYNVNIEEYTLKFKAMDRKVYFSAQHIIETNMYEALLYVYKELLIDQPDEGVDWNKHGIPILLSVNYLINKKIVELKKK